MSSCASPASPTAVTIRSVGPVRSSCSRPIPGSRRRTFTRSPPPARSPRRVNCSIATRSRLASRAGPHAWEALLYLAYSRLPPGGPGRSALEVARLLLDHGADPNAGYLWEGLSPPFTALTGAFGGGEGDPPPHPVGGWRLRDCCSNAAPIPMMGRRSTTAAAYAGDEWLELLFEFGLGSGDGGPWHRLLAPTARDAATDARRSADDCRPSRLHRPGPPAVGPWGRSRKHEGAAPVLWGPDAVRGGRTVGIPRDRRAAARRRRREQRRRGCLPVPRRLHGRRSGSRGTAARARSYDRRARRSPRTPTSS